MSTNKSHLIKWLNDQYTKGKDGEALRVIALRHLDADDRAQAVDDWPFKRGTDTADLAADIITSAERDALGIGSVQHYVVEAYFGTSKTRGRRYTITVDGVSSDENDQAQFRSEPRGQRGSEMQMRRHLENMHRLMIGTMETQQRIITAENQNLRDMVDKLMDKHYKVVDTYESLVDRKHKRDMEIEEMRADVEMRRDAIKQAIPLVQVFATRLLGSAAPPALPAAPAQEGQPAAASDQGATHVAFQNEDSAAFKLVAAHVMANQAEYQPKLMALFKDDLMLGLEIKGLFDHFQAGGGAQKEHEAVYKKFSNYLLAQEDRIPMLMGIFQAAPAMLVAIKGIVDKHGDYDAGEGGES